MPPKPRPNNKKPGTSKKNTGLSKQGNSVKNSVKNSEQKKVETTSGLTQEAEDQFELELCWCIQQLETSLAAGKHSDKQAQDLNKNINILKSSTAPLIKKRQVMHNTLGNYREKMALDVQKHGRTSSSMKFVTTCVQNEKCMFVKRAICKSTKEKQNLDNKVMTPNMDDDSVDCTQTAFKFNFQITE